ncbi:MAG TPA: SpoIIE family protein phosphatase [Vicinamibacteria bacterium]|nr:SpoIIE family protein phosphatase [Vicinamibacteria bacterium]
MAEIAIQTAGGTRERFPLGASRVTIGRSRESDIFLPDQWLSRHHAAIEERTDGYWVSDLKSKNGTLLNGEPVRDWHRLRPGDVITLGEHTLTFCADDAGEEEEEREPEGTRVFSVRELSAINTRPAIDAAELQRQNRVLAILSKAASELVVHRPLGELFDLVLELLLEAVTAERGAILLLEAGVPNIKASRSHSGDALTRVSRSIARRVIEERVSLLLPNVLEDARFRSEDSILASGIRTAMCAPLWVSAAGEGRDSVIGLVYVDSIQHAHAFTEDDLRVLTALSNVAAAKIENVRLLEESLEKRRMEEDMRMAAEIQTGLLPSSAPRIPGWDLAGSNQPCRTVGGDYYDFAVERGRLLLALGDVSGKGTGAALLMTVLRAAVRAHWMEPSLADAVSRINRTVCQNVPSSKYVTFFLASLDPITGHLEYVNAGHNPPILVRATGEVDKLTFGGLVLGIFEGVSYEGGTVVMEQGDTLIVYSDGVTETWDPEGEEFGEDKLIAFAVSARSKGADAVQAAILSEIEGFEQGARATDDRTLVVLKREARA